MQMVKLIKTVEKVAKAIIVQPNASFFREGAGCAPIIVLNSLSVAVVASSIIFIE